MPKWIRKGPSKFLGTIFVIGITLGFIPCSWGGHYNNSSKIEKKSLDIRYENSLILARKERRFPTRDKRQTEKQYEEWRSLSPEEKERLRHRMEQWDQMPPQQKNLYKKRYEQWEQIDPKERKKLEEKIFRWDKLSPEERDEIRRKFRE